MNFTIEHEREEDGRWLAEVPEIPGALAYGATANEAMAKAEVLALRVLAERLEHDEAGPQSISIAVSPAASTSRASCDCVCWPQAASRRWPSS